MRTIRTRTIACAVAMAAVLSLVPLRAQTTQAALSKEAGTLSDKFAGLARVMAGKYDWKPGEGVRSVSEDRLDGGRGCPSSASLGPIKMTPRIARPVDHNCSRPTTAIALQ